jgi:hypothetical protein
MTDKPTIPAPPPPSLSPAQEVKAELLRLARDRDHYADRVRVLEEEIHDLKLALRRKGLPV